MGRSQACPTVPSYVHILKRIIHETLLRNMEEQSMDIWNNLVALKGIIPSEKS
jgi:hypothetical protein